MKKIKAESLLPYAILFFHSFLLAFILLTSHNDILIAYTNFILFLPVVALLVLIPISWYAVYIIDAIVMFLVYYLSTFLSAVRGRPLNYLDFFCVKEALRVSSGYSVVFNAKIGITLAITVIVTFLACFALHKVQKEKLNRKKKAVSGIICLVVSVGMVFYYNVSYFTPNADKLNWNEELYVEQNGILGAVFSEYVSSKAVGPEGYTPQKAQSILERYDTSEIQSNDNTPDTIYVIMNESLADFSLIGEPVLNSDPLKNIHAMNDNCFKGKCAVNVFGGSTCNTEFEFLTGYSLMFISNSIPYIQYSFNNGKSIVADMNALDYHCTAVHPFVGTEWKRNTVYEQLGFADYVSGEKFSSRLDQEQYNEEKNKDHVGLNTDRFINFGDDLEYIRYFISDNECYNKLIEKASNKQDFIFSVTIQNHGGYGLEFNDENMVKYTDSKDSHLEQYLNLTRISDEAFEKFINKLRDSDEKSVVLMFGDHQPYVGIDKYSKKYSDNGNEYQKIADEYIVPYILWANYDIDWDAPEFTSVNYLSAVLKKNCNLPLTQFDQFRLDAMQEYPVITSHFAVDKNGEYRSPEDVEQSQIIQDYSMLQYNLLFDSDE